jgi:hypothetical protein
MQFFPDNTLTEFTTKLASTIELTDEWEVGLAEIMFPRSWYTIPKKGLIIEVSCQICGTLATLATNENKSIFYNTKIYLKGGYYNSMEELTLELNNAAQRAFDYVAKLPEGSIMPPIFSYKQAAKKMCITIQEGMTIEFPPELEVILGLSSMQNPLKNTSYENVTFGGEHSCDLQAGIHALYIYCDLLQFTHVGDIKAPLLRVVDSGGEAGDVVTRYYERPRYVPLQKKNFDSVEIVIRDDLGEKIQFENGKVLLTLHFRRAYNKYLI